MRRIVIIGAESTGKTTLAAALSEHFKEPWSREFVREYVKHLKRPLHAEDLETIAKGQLAIEDAATAKARKFVFHDTNLLSSIIYADHYFGEQIEWLDRCFSERDYALYLLCQPDIPWVADPGQREGPEVRDVLQAKFKRALLDRALPHLEISGSAPERLEQVRRVLEKMRSSKAVPASATRQMPESYKTRESD